jgi:hypothetical protein
MSKRLEIIANTAIIIVAAVAAVVLVRNLIVRRDARRIPPAIVTGTPLPLSEMDWRANGRTLVLAVSTSCHYCSESAPFYRRLAAELPRHGVHLTVLLPQEVSEGRSYLQHLGVPAADIRQAPLRELKIRGTPTLLLVDDRGIIRGVWEGKLSSDAEQNVLQAAAPAS